MQLKRIGPAFDRIYRMEQNSNLEKIEQANSTLESKMDALISGQIDEVALQTDIEQKLNDLETQYAPQLTEVTEQLADMPSLVNTFNAQKQVKFIGHRGMSAIAPENTIPSYEMAAKVGMWGAECDISVTSDGRWVLMHDDTVDRTTNGTGSVSDLTLTQIKNLTIDYGNNISYYPNLKVPTLEEFLVVCKKHGLVPVIELKSSADADSYDSLIRVIKDFGLEESTIIISFSLTSLQEVRSRSKNIMLQWIVADIQQYIIDNVKSLGNCGIDCASTVAAFTEENVKLCLAQGVPVNVWTVNNVNDAKRFMHWGVDYISTDCIGGVK